ncbi:NAD(P)-binding protein [Mycena haematopus]|nr:NAD(P)-binding protein [Mycena haematopus]
MSTYKSFAVVGAGAVGAPILSALAATPNISVILLSRPGSTKAAPSGVEIVPVDYTDAAAISAVLKAHKVDVVVSTINADAAGVQKALADGAKLASVKLFVPSEFGSPTAGHTGAVFAAKNEITAYLKSIGLPSLILYTGCFTEYIPHIISGVDGKMTIIGKGDAPISFTSLPDIAGFTAHVLTTLPPSRLENRTLRLQGARATWNEIAALFHLSIERVDAIPGTGPMAELLTALLRIFDTGAGSTGWDQLQQKDGEGEDAAGSANALWPGHHWQSIQEVHNL